jgi:hypothetical protein
MKYPNKKRNYPYKKQLNRKFRRIAFMLVAAAIAGGINYYNKNKPSVTHQESVTRLDSRTTSKPGSAPAAFTKTEQQQAVKKIEAAKQYTDSQFWIGLNGKVIKLLKDDLSGSRHQKFLIKISPDTSLLISHNIDLAARIPLKKNDEISLRGRYEWNNRGGVIHWTHHDPKGKKQGGWIKHHGKTYF